MGMEKVHSLSIVLQSTLRLQTACMVRLVIASDITQHGSAHKTSRVRAISLSWIYSTAWSTSGR